MSQLHARAAHLWRERRRSEREAALRFDMLASELAVLGAGQAVVDMARRAALDEHRHAAQCQDLVRHFGGAPDGADAPPLRRVAPRHLSARDRALYEVVAMSCVTETLSTALLGELVDRARDSVARSVMHSILRDEVSHSQLGWAYLAECHAQGARDCIGASLPRMLEATLGADLFARPRDPDPLASELSGLGRLDVETSQRVTRQTLEAVIFPGLERFGVDVSAGRAWLAARR